MSFSIFDVGDDGGLGLLKDIDVFEPIDYGGGEWYEPVGGGGVGLQPVDLMPIDPGPVDFEPGDIQPIHPVYYPIDPPIDVPVDVVHSPVYVPPASTPVQTVGATGNPPGTVPVSSAPVTGTTPAGSQPGIDPPLLLIGGAVLLAVLILK